MKSSNDIALKEALKCIKLKRRRFYREIWRRWAEREYCSLELSNDLLDFPLWARRYPNNPNKGSEIIMFIKALRIIGYKGSFLPSIIEGVHKEYLPRFKKYYLTPMVTGNGGIFPHLDCTKTVKELIARKWIHLGDSDIKGDKIYIKCHIAPLVWPEEFELHQDAIAMNNKMGIPGRTGTVLPKH